MHPALASASAFAFACIPDNPYLGISSSFFGSSFFGSSPLRCSLLGFLLLSRRLIRLGSFGSSSSGLGISVCLGFSCSVCLRLVSLDLVGSVCCAYKLVVLKHDKTSN